MPKAPRAGKKDALLGNDSENVPKNKAFFLGVGIAGGCADSNDSKMRFPAGRLYSRFIWEFKHVQTTEGSFGSNLEALEELSKYFIISGVQPFINQPFRGFLSLFGSFPSQEV